MGKLFGIKPITVILIGDKVAMSLKTVKNIDDGNIC